MTAPDDGLRPLTLDSRRTSLRLARVHLRLGSLALARAELEALSSHGILDDDGLLDLAEARWRTGDLPAAGEAAIALVDRGRDDVVALVIAAESIAAEGRPTEAKRLADRAVEAAGEPLDAVFAGMPRSSIWPGEVLEADDGAVAPAPDAAVPSTASAAAIDAYAGGRAALAAGDSSQAALRLAVAMRLEPGFAEAVLDAVGPRATDPALALVAGDALRLLGRETEARAAFDVARGAASPSPAAAPAPDAAESDDAGDDEDNSDEVS